MAASEQGAQGVQKVTVNMVSDVVCPWCIVGYQRLQEAVSYTHLTLPTIYSV